MRPQIVLCAMLSIFPPLFAQNPVEARPKLPKEPRLLLGAAAPLYAWENPDAKPVHVKGSYQLFDETGKATASGIYESWRSSAREYRSTWAREGTMHSEWHTAEGRDMYTSQGERLFYLERMLDGLLFHPMPDRSTVDDPSIELVQSDLSVGKNKLPCAEVKQRKASKGTSVGRRVMPDREYCFDPTLPVLRVEKLNNSVYVQFNDLAKSEGLVVAHSIVLSDGRQKLLSFQIDSLDEQNLASAQSAPPPDAKPMDMTDPNSWSEVPVLVRKSFPVYPQAAKANHVTGTVILDAIIGTDGHVKDVRVLATPSPLLTGAAKDAVTGWEYTPPTLKGRPMQVNTLIDVIFSMGT